MYACLSQVTWPLMVTILLHINQHTLMRNLISPLISWRGHWDLWSPLRWCPLPTTYGCTTEWTICSLSQEVPAGCSSPRSQTGPMHSQPRLTPISDDIVPLKAPVASMGNLLFYAALVSDSQTRWSDWDEIKCPYILFLCAELVGRWLC